MSIPIWKKAGIPVVVGTPVTAMDFGTSGVFAIGGGGGCLGVHTSLVQYASQALKSKKLGVPWADTPPGVFCYNDLESKPLDVLGYTNSGLKKPSKYLVQLPNLREQQKGRVTWESQLHLRPQAPKPEQPRSWRTSLTQSSTPMLDLHAGTL